MMESFILVQLTMYKEYCSETKGEVPDYLEELMSRKWTTETDKPDMGNILPKSIES